MEMWKQREGRYLSDYLVLLNLDNLLKIIRIAKHPAYQDSWLSIQLAYIRILLFRKVRSRKRNQRPRTNAMAAHTILALLGEGSKRRPEGGEWEPIKKLSEKKARPVIPSLHPTLES